MFLARKNHPFKKATSENKAGKQVSRQVGGWVGGNW